jgi:hypothetical protein
MSGCRANDDDRGVSLLNSSYKIYAKILTIRVHKIALSTLKEEQNGSRKAALA